MSVVKSLTIASGVITAGASGTVDTADIGDNQVTLAKIQQISTDRILGRDTAGTGNVEQLIVGQHLVLESGAIKVRLSQFAVTSSSDPGSLGDLTFDSNYGYYCVGPNAWKRFALEDIP